ncbi:hypothetical protein CAEBREN_03230 [Caenorhabditis brenneri]|uniref:Uncharacterized protein n=1 Tax=Caenorhabditis brenneri TaxID=135651 RepID=G0NFJ1_CAEBE|nr:hypothetical protein CAEBREN_03230 [Caenorhabditis brenneri]
MVFWPETSISKNMSSAKYLVIEQKIPYRLV